MARLQRKTERSFGTGNGGARRTPIKRHCHVTRYGGALGSSVKTERSFGIGNGGARRISISVPGKRRGPPHPHHTALPASRAMEMRSPRTNRRLAQTALLSIFAYPHK